LGCRHWLVQTCAHGTYFNCQMYGHAWEY